MSIKLISEMTGISYATVARALSGNGYCSKEKRDIIAKAAEKIHYHPNLSARTLRNNRTEKVLLGIPDICNAFYFRMIEGITEELDKVGYYPIIFNTHHLLDKELKLIDLLSQRYADGLILVSFNFTEANIDALRRTNLPAVLTNRYEGIREDDNFDFVYSDHVAGMEQVTSFMVEKGCKNILLVAGNENEQTSAERVQGYKNVLQQHNIPVRDEYILNGEFRTEPAHDAFAAFMQKGLPVDAVITANELMFMGVMRYMTEHGIDLDAFRIASFDNTDFSRNLNVTSLDLKQDEIGRSAVRLLMERIDGRRVKSEQVYLMPELIVRKT